MTTREGYAFMWDTNQPACGGNDEWWTSRHDEWNTGAYGTDTRPPGTPTGLTRVPRRRLGRRSTWTAPGDDWLCGQAAQYRVIASERPDRPPERRHGRRRLRRDRRPPGETEQPQRERRRQPYFAVLYQDDAGNWGHLRSSRPVMGGYARPKSATPVYTPLVPAYQPCASPNRTHAPP